MNKYASQAGRAVRYASRTTGVDFEKLLTWAAIAGIGFFGYKIYSGLSAVKDSLSSLGSALGSGLYDLFHPDQTGEMVFYNVLFPDGQKHAIPSRSVDSSGRFTYQGRRYQLLVDKGKQSGVNKYAVPVGN